MSRYFGRIKRHLDPEKEKVISSTTTKNSGISSILQLQQTVGNRAVATYLAMQSDTRAAFAYEVGDGGTGALQRGQTNTVLVKDPVAGFKEVKTDGRSEAVQENYTADMMNADIAAKSEKLQKLINKRDRIGHEIQKLQRDIEVWGKVKEWFLQQSEKKIVDSMEVSQKFNDLRWGGRGIRLGRIDGAGKPIVDKAYAQETPEEIVESVELHERIHAEDSNISTWTKYGALIAVKGEKAHSDAAELLINSELKAHSTQKEFLQEKYEGINRVVEFLLEDLQALRVRKQGTITIGKLK